MKNKEKIIVILGPTATGKSDLAVCLAKKFNGEIISADSRQVYSGMDIGTGKVTKKEMGGVSHYLLDVVSPKKVFTVVEYKKLAEKSIENILAKGKTPIICGGTGLYIQSVVDNLMVPDVPENKNLRTKLVKESPSELYTILKSIDPRRARNIDKQNPVRLIRAIEIASAIGRVPKIKKQRQKYDFLQIGLKLNREELDTKIHTRLIRRLRAGMVAEVKKLHNDGIGWKRLFNLGLEYRFVSLFISGKLSKEEMINKLEIAIRHYAKRQMTWFKRDKTIEWFEPKEYEKIETKVGKFLK